MYTWLRWAPCRVSICQLLGKCTRSISPVSLGQSGCGAGFFEPMPVTEEVKQQERRMTHITEVLWRMREASRWRSCSKRWFPRPFPSKNLGCQIVFLYEHLAWMRKLMYSTHPSRRTWVARESGGLPMHHRANALKFSSQFPLVCCHVNRTIDFTIFIFF